MKIGVVFPQTEIGPDAGAVKAFAQATEDLGYQHLLAYDHVLSANTANRPDWGGAYDLDDQFHEVMVLFGYLAGLTERIEFVSGILILPQRQTALVAKQAAEIDRLSNGRLRLGIGVGWNKVEYEGLNEDFHSRGKRSEEQIEVLRALWTNRSIEYSGKWHEIPDAGINPLPVQQPIPIWIGGYAKATMNRIGRIADGWFPGGVRPSDSFADDLKAIHAAARSAGRNPEDIQIEGRISLTRESSDTWADAAAAWQAVGATHLSVVTMGGDLAPDQHIDLLREFQETVGLSS